MKRITCLCCGKEINPDNSMEVKNLWHAFKELFVD